MGGTAPRGPLQARSTGEAPQRALNRVLGRGCARCEHPPLRLPGASSYLASMTRADAAQALGISTDLVPCRTEAGSGIEPLYEDLQTSEAAFLG
jgi:hypothetical protein